MTQLVTLYLPKNGAHRTNQCVREGVLRLPGLAQDGLGHERPLPRRLRARGGLAAVLGRGGASAAAVPVGALLAGGGRAARDPRRAAPATHL